MVDRGNGYSCTSKKGPVLSALPGAPSWLVALRSHWPRSARCWVASLLLAPVSDFVDQLSCQVPGGLVLLAPYWGLIDLGRSSRSASQTLMID